MVITMTVDKLTSLIDRGRIEMREGERTEKLEERGEWREGGREGG